MTELFLPTLTITVLGLAGLVIAKRRDSHGSTIQLMIIIALAGITVTEQVVLNPANDPYPFIRVLFILESFLPFLFLYYGFSYSRKGSTRELSYLWKGLLAGTIVFPVVAALMPMESLLYSPDMQREKIIFLRDGGYWFYMGSMIYCILALVNLEATFSSAHKGEKWKIKFELLGMGSVFAVFLFYFSQGLLYRTINMNLIPLRYGVVIVAAGMVMYSRLVRGNNVNIAVSMNVAYKSFTILVVGLYLLTLGLIGEGMRYLGVSASTELTVFIAFIVGIFMLIALFSGRIRRKAAVIIRKNFFRHKYDYRSEWLKYTQSFAPCKTPDEVRMKILNIYADTFGLQGAALFMRRADSNVFYAVARYGRDEGARTDMIVSEGLEEYFKEKERVYNPQDGEYAANDEEKSFVDSCGAGIIVPLVYNGMVSGLIVFGGMLSKESYIYEDYDLMKTLAREASLSLANLQLSDDLAEAREIAAVARISSFVIHDLKNHTSSLSMVLDNAEAHIDNPEFQKDMLGTLKSTVSRMKDLIQKLRNLPEKQSLQKTPVELHALVESEAGRLRTGQSGLELICEGTEVTTVADGEELRKVVLNLLLNACEATEGKGVVRVNTSRNGDRARVSVADDGCGMQKEFVEKYLFRPFRTTKEKGLGIGLYQSRQIVEAHGGQIEVQSSPHQGTVFTINLPLQGA